MKIILFLLIIILIVILQNKLEKYVNPCTDYLSDIDFLEHMIPHHQVAIDMSKMLQPISKSPIMHELFRKIIWQQNYEIEVMNEMIGKLPQPISTNKIRNNYINSKLSFYYPDKIKAQNGE